MSQERAVNDQHLASMGLGEEVLGVRSGRPSVKRGSSEGSLAQAVVAALADKAVGAMFSEHTADLYRQEVAERVLEAVETWNRAQLSQGGASDEEAG